MSRKTPSAKSLANLKEPWKPGQSGNPKGRPKHKIKALLNEWLLANGPEMVDKLGEMALKGNLGAICELLNRGIGKVTDKLEHSAAEPLAVGVYGKEAAVILGMKPENDEEE